MSKYDVLPYYLSETPWNLDFSKFFPDSEGAWDHPSVKDAMRKQAMMIMMQAMKGKTVKESVRKSAEFVLSKFVQNEASTQVHVSLTLEDVLKAKQKAGLPPSLKFLEKVTPSPQPIRAQVLETVEAVRTSNDQKKETDNS